MNIKDKRVAKIISDFVAKMNAIGIVPMVLPTDDDVTIAFSIPEMLRALKESLIKAGIKEDHLTVEIVPFKGDDYVKIYVKK